MKTLPHPASIWLLLVILTSCTSAPRPTGSPKPTETTTPQQPIQPNQVVNPTDLAFSMPLVQLLRQSGLRILSVQRSTYMSMFQSTHNAAWINTDEGIVEAVLFVDPAEATRIHIAQSPSTTAGRYLYTIQASPPTLLHDQTIDAAFPLYFTVERGMFLETSSAELDKTLKLILSER